MSLSQYVPPPKKAIGYAVLSFIVVVLAVGLGAHVAPANFVASAKAHVLTLWQKLWAKFKS